jgi:alkanesulfonate monooxygenase SsuD/methylene tetrahydromethanopterin reductase-like flavin-dependent oxidoreductase (luciferase family)
VRVGVGLPTRDGGLSPEGWVTWARRAEAGPFSSLAVLDRVVFPIHEPLIVLATLAAVTTRLELMTSALLGPTRETTLLARQAATLDAASGGRLVLGLGVGVREDDHAATGADFHTRRRRFDEQLPLLRRCWRGEPLRPPGIGAVGPRAARPDGPTVLIGGYVAAVERRIAAHGEGYLAPGGATPSQLAERWAGIEAAWRSRGRSGRPRFVGSSYVALGPDAERQAAEYIRSAYAFDPALAERRLAGIPQTPAAVRALIGRSRDLGMDELVLRPCAPDPTLLDRLADLLGDETPAGPGAGTR